ncbi:class I SAM-dependent rRNA methyltransferase [Lignipirellula cremea]|uniref:Ribosomal RNA large subunit methyltransferase I n=1 Tax=Lignipirellula cremea TaxID=2528010 RepID=A0A518DPK9_9BACT|nr:class I SAM-dependent rRNA methyltransferase [Lignipirellula cremea]QDU93772.1 Ribosomal RNA large subunit methyltransferase I [Lignipirellula cremea]
MSNDLPRVILKPRRAMPFFCRHPWVFAGAIRNVEGDPAPGAEVAVYSQEGKFIARGLYNAESNIRVRLYTWKENEAIDAAFWSARLDEAIAWRRRLYPHASETSAYRLVFSEADRLSGLIVDSYGPWLTVQITSRALADRTELLVGLLQEKIQPRGIWLRSDNEINVAEGIEQGDRLAVGEEPPRPLMIEENGLRLNVDLVGGQKTGYYLDQRENRQAVARYAAGGRMLDMFCYTGGFALAAAKQGAVEVLGIDSSEPSLAAATANAELNGLSDIVKFERADAFRKLEELVSEGRTFDTVVLDPPRMTRKASNTPKALRGYYRLNQVAMRLLPPGGILTTCSCSGLVSKSDFQGLLADVALHANRTLQVLEARAAAPDHPMAIQCPETDYLKCFICRVV